MIDNNYTEIREPMIEKKLWEKQPTLIIELTEKEIEMMERIREAMGECFDWLTVATMIIKMREAKK